MDDEAATELYLFGDFQLNVSGRELKRSGTPVGLTGKPFDVLVYLIRHKHRIVAKEELYKEFWKGEWDALAANTVEGVLVKVRRKLNESTKQPRYIKTFPRHGCQFIFPIQPECRATTFVTAPPIVENYIDRPEALTALRTLLLEEGGNRAVALTALEGMGGVGKTVMAQALFKDEAVRDAFPDGLIWITVGREPTHDVKTRLGEIVRLLGGTSEEAVAPETLYRTLILDKAVLLVIDDIWDKTDLEPFLAESPRSRFLFTTRNARIARFCSAREYRVDLLDGPQSRDLLARWAGIETGQIASAGEDVLRECGGLPLALSTVGALLRGAAPAEWDDAARLLRNADLSAIEEQLPLGQQSFFRAINVSVKALEPKMQQWYGCLAVLLDDMSAPLPVLEALWSVNEGDARRISRLLADRSLARLDDAGGMVLHDLQLDYVRAQYPDRAALELIRGAVRLSAHVIRKDPRQFASQVCGRLLPHDQFPAVHQFAQSVARGTRWPWLRLLHPTLEAPNITLFPPLEGHYAGIQGVSVIGNGRAISASLDETLKLWDLKTGRVISTLKGHASAVYAVAVTGDGQRAISASQDRTLRFWDLETGRTLQTLEGHAFPVSCVAVRFDGRRAISASWDSTLKLWDLETGRMLQTLAGHSDCVNGVAVSADWRLAVSASQDKSLKVWDLETGRALRTLEGHSSDVWGVAMSADGRLAISASEDKTLKVWDVESGRELSALKSHSSPVYGVALSGDGRLAVSASGDGSLKVWDLKTAQVVHTLKGHSAAVFGAAISVDTRLVVSVSDDATLKVWNVESGQEICSMPGHTNAVNGMATTDDGCLAVFASSDQTLKLWDLESECEAGKLVGHASFVYGVAVSGDGRLAVSASSDDTLKVWDLRSRSVLRTLKGHKSGVWSAAVSPDGHLAVSASDDKTLRVWDLETGRVLRTLKGHKEPVYDVALSADGRRVISASADKTLKVWDLEADAEPRTLKGHSEMVNGVAMTADGRLAVSAADEWTLKVWDLQSGLAVHTLEGHSDSVNRVAISADAKLAVSASWDKTLTVWDLGAGVPLATFTCDAPALCCGFIRNQKLIGCDHLGRIHFLLLDLGTG